MQTILSFGFSKCMSLASGKILSDFGVADPAATCKRPCGITVQLPRAVLESLARRRLVMVRWNHLAVSHCMATGDGGFGW